MSNDPRPTLTTNDGAILHHRGSLSGLRTARKIVTDHARDRDDSAMMLRRIDNLIEMFETAIDDMDKR